jgi:hypothetical protein
VIHCVCQLMGIVFQLCRCGVFMHHFVSVFWVGEFHLLRAQCFCARVFSQTPPCRHCLVHLPYHRPVLSSSHSSTTYRWCCCPNSPRACARHGCARWCFARRRCRGGRCRRRMWTTICWRYGCGGLEAFFCHIDIPFIFCRLAFTLVLHLTLYHHQVRCPDCAWYVFLNRGVVLFLPLVCRQFAAATPTLRRLAITTQDARAGDLDHLAAACRRALHVSAAASLQMPANPVSASSSSVLSRATA